MKAARSVAAFASEWGWFILGWLAVTAMTLVPIYLLVRFIKWAWQD